MPAARKGAGAKASASPKRKVIDLPDASPETMAAALEEQSQEEPALSFAEKQEIERENRRKIAVEAPLDPNTLCGSWGLYHAPSSQFDDAKTEQALIVAEVQPGIYLCEFYDVVSDEPREQRIVTVEEFSKRSEGGGRWAFYDERIDVRRAFRRLVG